MTDRFPFCPNLPVRCLEYAGRIIEARKVLYTPFSDEHQSLESGRTRQEVVAAGASRCPDHCHHRRGLLRHASARFRVVKNGDTHADGNFDAAADRYADAHSRSDRNSSTGSDRNRPPRPHRNSATGPDCDP